jgi:TolB-like protein/Tfp pilus assembly protein PilF
VLHIRLFGGFEARAGDGPAIELPTKKTQALFAYLAIRPGEARTREKIADLLWSDRGDAQAKASLRQALTALRKALKRLDPDALSVEGELLSLDPSAVEVDVERFERLVEEGSTGSLEEAASLYRGDLLDGLDARDPVFDDWLTVERERLRERAIDGLIQLLDRQTIADQPERAIDTAKRLLTLDPLREASHRALMGLYAARGERSHAIRQYETCRDLLKEQLGVEPEAETEALFTAIRKGDIGVAPSKAADVDAPKAMAKDPDFVALPEKPLIAVLPFANLSGDPEQDFFADGLTRELITQLGRFSTTRVVAAASTFAYKGRSIGVVEVGLALHASYVVEGSVQKSGERVRITAQATDAKTGAQVWGEHFDGDLGNIFDMQDTIARRIASNLYEPLMDKAVLEARRKPPTSADAYDLYLQAYRYMDKPTVKGMEEARRFARKVLAIDPGFALVYEILAWSHIHDAWNGWVEEPEAALQSAREEAARGVALDDKEAGARSALGFAEVFLGETERGLKESRASVALNPNVAPHVMLLGGALALAGRVDEALAALEEAEGLSPGYHPIRLFQGDAHFAAGRAEEAVGCYEEFLRVLPHFGWALLHLAACHVEQGHFEAAREVLVRLRAESPNMTPAYLRRLLRARDPAFVERLLGLLQTAGFDEGEGRQPEPAAEESAALPLPDKPSIAVLPFKNLSGDPEQEYFSDGITEDIITELSRFRSLFVIARNSSFHYKGQSPKVQEVGQELGVEYVVEGSVRKAGNRIRVTAQLVEAATGNHLWAEHYDRDLEDVFALQDEISHTISSTLADRVEDDRLQYAKSKDERNLAVYDFILRGRALAWKYTRDDNAKAREMFTKAIELGPDNAEAYAWLAQCLAWDFEGWWVEDPEQSLELAFQCATKAFGMNATDKQTQASLAYTYLYKRQHDQAIHYFQRALALVPGDAGTISIYGMCLVFAGDADAGLAEIAKSERLSPMAIGLSEWNVVVRGMALYTMRRYEDALAAFRKIPYPAVEVHGWLAACYAQLGEDEAAHAALEDFEAHAREEFPTFPGDTPDGWARYWWWMEPYRDDDDLEHVLEGLRKAGLPV